MEIEYLKQLENNPFRFNYPDINNEPTPESEILHLEQLYNQGKTFPKALRELLYLAGNFCYVLDYGINESQEELQEFVREELNYYNKEISRPFFAIDVYNASDQFLLIYLDEGDNPAVHEAIYYENSLRWIRLISYNLSQYIDNLIVRVKEGRNAF
jgi:hypothetical protein